MFKSQAATIGILAIALLVSLSAGCTVMEVSAIEVEPGDGGPSRAHVVVPVKVSVVSGVQMTLSAAQTTVSWDERLPDGETFDLPLLYLHHERATAEEAERTLVLDIAGLAKGDEGEIEALSAHVNPSTGAQHRASKRFTANRDCTANDPCTVEWTVDASNMLSDLYDLQVRDGEGKLLADPHPERPEFVALDTWEVGIDGHKVRIYYATLFPFVRGQEDVEDRLAPAAVTDFVEKQFVPMVVDTWHTQFREWGFGPIHPEWDADKVVEVFITCPPFALFGGTGIYTTSFRSDGTPHPERRLWWFSSSPTYDAFDTLERGYKVIFAHEFFHMVQRNVALSAGCSLEQWNNVFIEAQGAFAPSVQYPELEILNDHLAGPSSPYRSAARRFLAHGLNASYSDLEGETVHRYDAALYWRFLYEQFGDMGIIRAALEEMACRYDPDIEAGLAKVMDAALARFDGPFQTHEESLVAFARANYGLRLQNGRCAAADAAGCGAVGAGELYYDPQDTYKAPALEAELPYSGRTMSHRGAIPAVYGMDFLEVRLGRELHGQPLRMAIEGQGRFSVELWELGGGAGGGELSLASDRGDRGAKLRALTPHPVTMAAGDDGHHTVLFPHLDTMACERIALIIVRLGGDAEASGAYTVTLEAGSEGDGGTAGSL